MSRAFVKDAEYLEELPERPVSEHPNDVTEAGLAQIEHAVQAASEAYAKAQASADRAALAAAGRDLRYWTARRATARVVPAPADPSEVRFGTAVTIMRDDGREQTFRIVGEDEADPAQGSLDDVGSAMRRRLLDLIARKFGGPHRAARLHQVVHEGGLFRGCKIRIGHSPEFSADDEVAAIRRNRMLRRSHQRGLALLKRTGHWIRMISASPAPA